MRDSYYALWEWFNVVGATLILGYLVYVGRMRHNAKDWLGGDFLAPMAFCWAIGIVWGSFLKYKDEQHYTVAATAITLGVIFGLVSMVVAWHRGT